jgi:hypothetical protein
MKYHVIQYWIYSTVYSGCDAVPIPDPPYSTGCQFFGLAENFEKICSLSDFFSKIIIGQNVNCKIIRVHFQIMIFFNTTHIKQRDQAGAGAIII